MPLNLVNNIKILDYIGVADGVGGWRSRGYDPSVFSASLMRICKDMAGKKSSDPLKLIDDSYNKVKKMN
jgi:protein phosphatase PTC7